MQRCSRLDSSDRSRSSGQTLSSGARWPPINVEEHTIEVAGASVFYRRAPATGAPVVYLHGAPTSSDDWTELLAATGGLAPDLPGFGRSSKAGNLESTLPAYADFVASFMDALQAESVILIGHGWGAAIGLLFAQRHPARVQRLAIVDAVPLLDGFAWPRLVGYLRHPGIGELLMGSITKRVLARILRRGSTSPAEVWSGPRVDAVWEQFDQGTQRAILRLQRSASPRALAEAGAGLHRLGQPALVLWGEQDPWLAADLADAYGARLLNATVARIAGAGHWPWLDQPAARERLRDFAQAPQAR